MNVLRYIYSIILAASLFFSWNVMSELNERRSAYDDAQKELNEFRLQLSRQGSIGGAKKIQQECNVVTKMLPVAVSNNKPALSAGSVSKSVAGDVGIQAVSPDSMIAKSVVRSTEKLVEFQTSKERYEFYEKASKQPVVDLNVEGLQLNAALKMPEQYRDMVSDLNCRSGVCVFEVRLPESVTEQMFITELVKASASIDGFWSNVSSWREKGQVVAAGVVVKNINSPRD